MEKNKTVHIPPELHKKQKLEALKRGIALKELIERKLERPLDDK